LSSLQNYCKLSEYQIAKIFPHPITPKLFPHFKKIAIFAEYQPRTLMYKSNDAYSQPNLLVRVFRFYRDGFRSMTVGRTLWAIIAVKLVVFFLILRWLLFPDFLAGKADSDQGKAEYVREQITKR